MVPSQYINLIYCVVTSMTAVGASQTESSAQAFQTRWRPSAETAMADAAALPSLMPSHCKLAVVGAGWGGAYMAWRLAIDDGTLFGPSDVCVFEASNRVGGRVFSVRNLPGLGDTTIDAGGYRFIESDMLPAQLVWDALKLPTACYDYNCSAQCMGSNVCYVIRDAYGNNAGYAKPIETMLGQLEDEGQGQQVFFGKQLSGIFAANSETGTPRFQQVTLAFADNTSVIADKVLLNMPSTALESLDKTSLIFTGSTSTVQRNLRKVERVPAAKVYAVYEDAWWASKLGFMEGYIRTDASGNESKIPLSGRYHDGPLRCVIGHTPAGDPVYSGKKVPFGNCSGALEVYYNFNNTFFQQFMKDPMKPLSVYSRKSVKGSKIINDVHRSLMDYHEDAFRKQGIEPTKLGKPTLLVISNWLVDADIAPVCGHFSGSLQEEASIRKPAAQYDIYLADVDFGYSGCWATGSLIGAEKLLHAEFGLGKPAWLQTAWYDNKILAIPTEFTV